MLDICSEILRALKGANVNVGRALVNSVEKLNLWNLKDLFKLCFNQPSGFEEEVNTSFNNENSVVFLPQDIQRFELKPLDACKLS